MKLLIILFVSSVVTHIISGRITHQYHVNLGLESIKVVINPLNDAIPFYSINSVNHSVIGYLESGKSLPFAYEGESGSWKYVQFENKVVVIHDKGAALGYEIEHRWYVSLSWLNIVYTWTLISSVLLFLLIVFLLQVSKRKTPHNMSNQHLAEAHYYKQKSDLKETENSELKRIIEQQQNTYSEKEKQFSEKMKHEIDRLHLELKKTVKIESEARLRASIEEMQTSYDRLLEKYQRVIDEAKEFGIDFNDNLYEKLLAGRRYEICVATNLVNEGQFKILEWTPDKGFESNVKVEANTNPDLIVEDKDGDVLAIECKYRSKVYFRGKMNEISWAKLYQMIRYIQFAKDRSIPVWIALGFEGDPRMPKCHYLIPLQKLNRNSRNEEPDGKGKQVIIKRSVILDDIVKNGSYAAHYVNVKSTQIIQ